MSTKIELQVDNCTQSSNGGFILTLKEPRPTGEVVKTVFGKTKRSEFGQTFYMKVEDQVAIGFEAEIDLEDYNIVHKPFTTDDGKELDLKWLFLK